MFNLLFLHQFQINIEKLFMHCSKCSFLFNDSKTGQIQHCATAPFYSYFFLNHQKKDRKSGVKQKAKQTMSVMNSRLLFLLNYFQFFILLTLAVKSQGFEISLSLI